jgi:hypothetical protein
MKHPCGSRPTIERVPDSAVFGARLWVPETRSGLRCASSKVASESVVRERARRTGGFAAWAGRGRRDSSGLAVLVDESATRGVSSDRLAGSIRCDHVVRRCALFERPVGTVGVVVLDVVA